MKRGTGKSTVQALYYLAQAIDNPGKTVTYIDHAQHYAPGAAKYWANQLRNMINVLGLKQVTVDYSPRTGKISIKSEWEGIEV